MTVPLDLITADNSALALIDYQPAMLQGVGSNDRTTLMNATIAATKAAAILEVPVVFSSIYTKGNGEFFPSIADVVPDSKIYQRSVPGFDALEDGPFAAALKTTGRRKVIVAGLWTSMCFAYTALHALRDGYEAYGLMDAAGDASVEAHRYGIDRMVQAGVVPTTWMPLVSEWMHDWANPKAGQLSTEVYGAYDPLLAG